MEIILTSILAFGSTNIDDIFILTLFFGDKKYKTSDIYLGQYVGIIILTIVSVIASYTGNFIDSKYIGLMGLFPLYLGLQQIIGLIKRDHKAITLEKKEGFFSDRGMLSIATVTCANGGDNIGTYIPLFAAQTTPEKSIMIAIFMAMVLIWLATAKYLTTHPILIKGISKYGNIITPVVLCLLGLFILKENGSLDLFK